MKFTERLNRELVDIEIPGIFVSNNMFNLDEISLKLYIYIKFLIKSNINFSEEDIAKKLSVRVCDIEKAFDTLEEEELILKTTDGYEILDIKEQEINKTYIPKLKPVKAAKTITEQKRIAAAKAINDSFFQGIMALGWYVDISTLFEKYGFDEDVMIALFHECSERKALKKNYVFKVAESWYKGGVKTFEQLEDYLTYQEEFSKIKSKIKSKLRLNRAFTEYEEQYIRNWIDKFKYTFDEIDHAIKKTLAKGNPSIGYIDGILKNWHEKGYKNLAKILAAEETLTKENISAKPQVQVPKVQKRREYEQKKDIDLNVYYDNL
ncbi:MAG: DnaD domain protein [Clostridia bacterium]|nr:DnaD domain protein [Clostridia bacterium]